MRFGLSIIAAVTLTALLSVSASAQHAVRPRWNYQGSAVCPDGYDYYASQGACISRGGSDYGRGYGGGYGGGGVLAGTARGLPFVRKVTTITPIRDCAGRSK
jgi:hypothetical protein